MARVLFFFFFLVFGVSNANGQSDILSQLGSMNNLLGEDNVTLLEAMAYESGNEVKQDTNKAIALYYQAFKDNNPISAYKLGMFFWDLENKKASAEPFKKLVGGNIDPSYYFAKGSAMRDKERNNDITNLLGVVNGVYLYLHDKPKESIRVLSERKSIQDHPTAQIYLSFAYYKLKDVRMAEFFLNRACNNPAKTKDITALCNSDKVKKVKID